MIKVKCPPFCKPNCNQKHHDLLLAVLNSPSDSKGGKKTENNGDLEELEACVQNYLKKGWQKNMVVPDAVKEYQFPLVHWASVLGKLKALEWLIKNGFDPTVRARDTQETALHRCLLCLELSEINLPRKPLERKMGAIIDLLKDCLALKDKEWDTPLHVAARQLLEGRRKVHFGECFKLLLSKLKECFPDKLKEILDAQNKAGDTVVHVLAKSDEAFFSLRSVINDGAAASIVNGEGKTPLDVAAELGSIRATTLLKRVTNEKMPNSSDEVELNGIMNDPDKVQEQNDTSCPDVSHHPVCTCKIKKEHCNNSQDNITPEDFNSDQNSSLLLDVLRGAGLWSSVKELAINKRKEKEKVLTVKLEELQATNDALEDAEKVVEDTQAKITSKEKELEKIKKELAEKKTELNHVKNEHQELKRKRHLLNNECSRLEKKLHCCDSLLKVNEEDPPENGDETCYYGKN